MAHAPPTQRNPVLLMAVLHWLVLGGAEQALAGWYPTVTPSPRPIDDPALESAVGEFVAAHVDAICEALPHRRTQTNEVGRCALFVAALSRLPDLSGPLAHVDIGTSAGLNLGLPHYAYRFDDGPALGTGKLTLHCDTRAAGFVPTATPSIVRSIGIDSNPLDVSNPDDARWLQACVWPDQADRFDRLRLAIEIALAHPPDVRKGDATTALASVLAEAADAGHPVITSSWVLNYFSPDERKAFLAELDRIGRSSDLTFVFAESPAQTPELPHPESMRDRHTTMLGLITWRSGHRSITPVAETHPHGYWYDRIS